MEIVSRSPKLPPQRIQRKQRTQAKVLVIRLARRWHLNTACFSSFAPLKFEILEDPEPERPPFSFHVPAIFDESMQAIPPQGMLTQSFTLGTRGKSKKIHPAGNAMKTAFRTLNADEVETGSRGGMDGAMAAQPADDARPMPVPFSDSSSSSLGDESYCTPQRFSLDLNAMQVCKLSSKLK